MSDAKGIPTGLYDEAIHQAVREAPSLDGLGALAFTILGETGADLPVNIDGELAVVGREVLNAARALSGTE